MLNFCDYLCVCQAQGCKHMDNLFSDLIADILDFIKIELETKCDSCTEQLVWWDENRQMNKIQGLNTKAN